MAGQSLVDCCNNALQKLGMPSIMSLTDNSRQARQCALAADNNRRSELRKYNWNFAITRAQLAPDVATPAFDYLYQFSLPSDCLRVLLPNQSSIGATPPLYGPVDWVLEGRKILSNCSIQYYDGVITSSATPSLNLRYIADILDPNQYDASFYEVYYIAMAIDMCEALTNSTSKKANLEGEYRESVAKARLANAFERTPTDAPDDSFWTCRF